MDNRDNKKAPIVTDPPTFRQVVSTFIDHIESLSTSIPLVMGTIMLTNQKATKLHQEFLKKDCEKKVEKGSEFFIIKREHARRNELLRKEVIKSSIAFELVQRNFIVSVVSQFDAYLASLIRTMFYVKPELLNASEKQLTFSSLMGFKGLEDARQYIIEKEIESVLRDSHSDQFKWLENKIGVSLRKDLPIWPTFIELTQRRNLYVHNNGNVSNQYLAVCKENNVKFENEPAVGDELRMSREYFETAFRCIFEVGVKLSQVLWRRLLPSNLEEADKSLLDVTYELIYNEQYDLAREILDFSDKYIKKFFSDDLKFRLILNRAQTYKWLGHTDKCQEIIKAKDWSACSDIFKLASQVLLEEYETAAETLKQLAQNNQQIDKSDYKEWPIFKEFRKQECFLQAYEEGYGEPYDINNRYAKSGFQIIDRDTFFERLDDCLNIAGKKRNGFVGSKFFIETHLAQRNFDIGNSWELYNELEGEGVIETYRHSDPDGIFPEISAVRKKNKE